jgi:hypothetical protein
MRSRIEKQEFNTTKKRYHIDFDRKEITYSCANCRGQGFIEHVLHDGRIEVARCAECNMDEKYFGIAPFDMMKMKRIFPRCSTYKIVTREKRKFYHELIVGLWSGKISLLEGADICNSLAGESELSGWKDVTNEFRRMESEKHPVAVTENIPDDDIPF